MIVRVLLVVALVVGFGTFDTLFPAASAEAATRCPSSSIPAWIQTLGPDRGPDDFDYVVDVPNRSHAPAKQVVSWPPNVPLTGNQIWCRTGPLDQMRYQNLESGLCLEQSGRKVQQNSCTSTSNQMWRRREVSAGWYWIQNIGSGQCLDIEGGNTSAGAPVIAFDCKITWNQFWLNRTLTM
jgi:hypothetical protein